jgi:hypothetical protein
LHLLDGQLRQLGPFVPTVADVQLGLMGVIHVLVEKLVERSAG